MSFLNELEDVIKESSANNPSFRTKENVLDDIFQKATTKYLIEVRESIIRAAKKGVKEKYINFDRNQFKANYPGLPVPAEIKKLWLAEMCNPNSKYLIENPNQPGKKVSLEGITYEVWNNFNFTVKFQW